MGKGKIVVVGKKEESCVIHRYGQSGKATLADVLVSMETVAPLNGGNGHGEKVEVDGASSAGTSGVASLRAQVSVDAAAKTAARQRSEEVFASANDYFVLCRQIAELAQSEYAEFDPELERLLAEKKRVEDVLAKQPAGVQAQFRFDLFLCEIRNLQPVSDVDVLSVLEKIENMGRARKPSQEEVGRFGKNNWPGLKERIYFVDSKGGKHNLLHVPSKLPGREGQVSPADKRLFEETRQMISRYLRYKEQLEDEAEEKDLAKIEELRQRQGDFDSVEIFNKKAGIYVLYLPGKWIGQDDAKKQVGMPGAALVRLYDRNEKKGGDSYWVLEVLEAYGCLKPKWALPELKYEAARHWIAWWWLDYYVSNHQRQEHPYPANIPNVIAEPVQAFIRKAYAAIRNWRQQRRWEQEPVFGKKEEEKEAEGIK